MAIHPTAIVNPKAEISPSAEVGPYCVIDADVRLGEGCRLYQNVYLTGHTEIGEGCVFHPGVVVGHEPQDTKYDGAKTFCRLGKRNVLREHVTIHRGTEPDSATVIGNDCLFFAGSHVGHNCVVGDGNILINNTMLSGHVTTEDRVTFGGGAGVHQFARIGRLSMVAGNAAVTKDILPFALTDRDGRIAGLNKVGLRRADTPRTQIDELSTAFRLFFQAGSSFTESVDAVAALVTHPPGHHLSQFLQTTSKRGIAGRTR